MSLSHQLGGGEIADILEPGQFLPPPRDAQSNAPPSIVDTLRACGPSRELLGFLSRESMAAAREKREGDATALLMFALCVKAALAAPVTVEDPPCPAF